MLFPSMIVYCVVVFECLSALTFGICNGPRGRYQIRKEVGHQDHALTLQIVGLVVLNLGSLSRFIVRPDRMSIAI